MKPIKPFKNQSVYCLATFEEEVRNSIKENEGSESPVVLITHLNCIDGTGVAAAFTAWMDDKFPSVKFDTIFLDYDGYEPETIIDRVTDKVVFTADFSFDIKTHKKMTTASRYSITLDHHETPYHSPVSDEDNTYFDMNYSGAVLAWNFLYPSTVVPKVLLLVEDYDLYRFNFEMESRALQMYGKSITLSDPDALVKFIYKPELLEDVIKQFEPQVKPYMEKCANTASNAELFTVQGEPFMGINISSNVSDVLNKVCRNTDLPSFSWKIKNGTMCMSFRSIGDKVNVAKFAEEHFYGGGHSNASGCKVDISKFDFNLFIKDKVLRYKKNNQFR